MSKFFSLLFICLFSFSAFSQKRSNFREREIAIQQSNIQLGEALLLIAEGAELNPNQDYNYSGFILLATVMYAANVNIIKRFLNEVSPLAIATANFIVIFIPSLLVLFFSKALHSETIQRPEFSFSMLCIVILSIFGTALAKILFNTLIQISTPVFASSVTYLMPFVALLWGIMDSEIFNLKQVLSLLIILSGIYLVNKKT